MRDTNIDMTEIAAVAAELADAARAVILPHFRSATLAAENKQDGGFDPVTEADRAAERAMRDILATRRPQDGILGEEYGASTGSSGLTWVLDPIDGTRAFICGTPTWGVLIALSDAGGVRFGMIDQPFTGERFSGGTGGATWIGREGETRTLATSGIKALSDARLMTTFPEVGTLAEGRAFAKVASQAKLTRYGMDCYAYALLAAGHVDLVIEAGLNPYDIQGPIGVIEAAGGVVTDWNGGAAHHGGRAIAAATPELHAEALALLRDVA
ncbi:myo-inositol-1(or 4)-monophosphatase [Roseivivax halotolerans]|uniref:Histidinol-phosphatase n=2 Tax=Roseivivax halotolerans TaxID=93684 RepID=A0A1I5ZJ40_9RHOB|nr:myo-inositol-1(or 4)-monophosphatase [Roseivivax halotolerans]